MLELQRCGCGAKECELGCYKELPVYLLQSTSPGEASFKYATQDDALAFNSFLPLSQLNFNAAAELPTTPKKLLR